MPCITYVDRKFSPESLQVIEQAREICEAYAEQGFDLTLRQLYYQFVSRDLIPNRDSEYKRLGSIINDARLAGLLDWNFIVDRTRNLRSLAHWTSPQDIMHAVGSQYRVDKWATQPRRVEVWIEKDALVGVIERVCNRNDVPFFSCRGYTSQSEVWSAAQRLLGYARDGQTPVILHLGDHDPSGIDMTRDIGARLDLFMSSEGESVAIDRLALNMDQVRKYKPPPNPAKLTDSRCTAYIKVHGNESWELDALEPTTIDGLIQKSIEQLRDDDAWEKAEAEESEAKRLLTQAARSWEAVAGFLRRRPTGGGR
jgi:hypothetical protein